MKHLQDNKTYYTHKQNAFEKGMKHMIDKMTSLIDSLDSNTEKTQELKSICDDMVKGLEERKEIVEIIGRVSYSYKSSHSYKDKEHLTIKFIRQNLVMDIDAETFNTYYCPAPY